MKIEYHQLHSKASFARATSGSAGFDLTACVDVPLVVHPGCIERVPLGIAIDLSDTGGALLMARSSLSKRGLMLANGVGLIDRDYRGELVAAVVNTSNSVAVIDPWQRIAQLVILPRADVALIQRVDSLGDTARGAGGFGSTGAGVFLGACGFESTGA